MNDGQTEPFGSKGVGVTLEEDIIARSREIKTDGYAMSIGEMMSMYRDGDLDVHPEFQRIFRWTEPQKWRLIESILLGIPIPMIFVAQRPDGVWDVIDGVQRLSTILEFAGEYVDEEGAKVPGLVLGETEYLPQLAGYRWGSDEPTDDEPTLVGGLCFSDTLRRDFKRARLEFRIVKKDSDPDAKYDLFQRLNSGTQLSAQESRNCLLVMLNADFYRWMTRLAVSPTFVECTPLSDQKQDEGFRQELVLRFIMQSEFVGESKDLPKELGDYVTDWVRDASSRLSVQESAWTTRFDRCFDLLQTALGDDTFRRYDSTRNRFLGAFSISAYETITAGVAAHIDQWTALPDPSGSLKEQIKLLWDDEYFRNNSGSGVSPRRRAPRLINRGREFFDPSRL